MLHSPEWCGVVWVVWWCGGVVVWWRRWWDPFTQASLLPARAMMLAAVGKLPHEGDKDYTMLAKRKSGTYGLCVADKSSEVDGHVRYCTCLAESNPTSRLQLRPATAL